jgi:hypothetical protein
LPHRNTSILIKDDATPFSFDTQLIPHLPYRRDLRMHETLAFQKQLSDKIKQVHEESQQSGYKSFLEQFTSYTLAQIDEQQVGVPEYLNRLADRMQGLEDTVKQLSSRLARTGGPSSSSAQQRTFIPFQDNSLGIPEIKKYLASKAEALDFRAPLLPVEIGRLRDAFASRFSSFTARTTSEALNELIKELGDEALFEVGRVKAS